MALKLPTGETVRLARGDARVLAQRLWDVAPYPGAALLAVRINDAVASTFRTRWIELSEREYGALREAREGQSP